MSMTRAVSGALELRWDVERIRKDFPLLHQEVHRRSNLPSPGHRRHGGQAAGPFTPAVGAANGTVRPLLFCWERQGR